MPMNPQNVAQLSRFFSENQEIPLETLKQSCLDTGYKPEEIAAALSSLPGVSHPGVGSAALPASHTTNDKKKLKLAVGGLALLTLLGALFAGGVALSERSRANQVSRTSATNKTANTPKAPTIIPTAPATPTPTIPATNPLTGIKQELTSKIFKVDTKGQLIASVSADTVKLNLEDASFYLKNGDVVRADLREQNSKQTLLLSRGNFYFLENTGETVAQLNTAGKSATDSPYFALLHYGLPIIGLIEAQEQRRLVWQKISEYEWQTEWSYPLLARGSSTVFPVKIRLSTSSNLPETFSLKKDIQSPWQDISISYTRLDTVEPLLIIPKAYKVVDLYAPASSPSATPKP